ncbi:MAG: DUF294 nucleotidyltransferase-like domain-containing protein [Desulfobacterales bacterium]|nr:DUF294 nucleotidyltransferase-like domain-containing protein [Desulfobacterales bacterium]
MIGPRMEINKNPYAIVALGGYGREEQSLHSDVDLLFLFGKRIPPEAENLIREMIYPLWDIGMDVGYATRSLKECLSLAAKDLNVLTPHPGRPFHLRHVDAVLRADGAAAGQGHPQASGPHSASRSIAYTRGRHAQFGDSALSAGAPPQGGPGRAARLPQRCSGWRGSNVDLRQPRDLEYLGLLSHAEYQELWEALEFIWTVRNHLHHISGRKTDQLHFETQITHRRTAEVQGRGRAAAGGALPGRAARPDGVGETASTCMLLHELGLENEERRREPRPRPRWRGSRSSPGAC